MARKPKEERRPNPGKPSRFRPGDPVLLHARVREVREIEGETVITCTVTGWPITNGVLYVREDAAEPDPLPE